ncbi:MAG: MG2 domain-containing protein, partial [Thermodesulfobacteriota bacterium]
MSRGFVNSLLSVALLSLFLLPAAFPAAAQAPQPLKVLAVHPRGEVPRVKQFTITFNQPMIPLGDMAQTAETSPVVITPEMEGTFRWLNVYTLAFEPKVPLEGSLAGRILIKAGTTALSGAKLDQDLTVDYSLPSIGLLQAAPQPGSANLPLEPQIVLFFNQPLDLEKLRELAYFRTARGQKAPVTVKEDEEANRDRQPGAGWAVVFQPARKLTPDTDFDLVLPPGLVSLAGPLPSDQTISVPYRTYGPFRIVAVEGYSPQPGAPLDPESGVEIKFTNRVRVKDALKALKITPAYDLGPLIEEEGESPEESEEEDLANSLWIPGPFKPAALHTFQLARDLRDEFGQTLTGRASWRVAFGPARPILELPGRQGVLEQSEDPTYPFLARNLSSVQARGYFLDPERVVPFIIRSGLFRYIYESDKDLLAAVDPGEIKTARINVALPPNAAAYQPVRLKDLFGPAPGPGLMYFDLSAKETNDREDGRRIYYRALVQVSDLGLSVKFGLTNALIWTTDLKTGRPLAGVRVELRDAANQVLWRGLSDEQGLVTAPGAADLGVKRDEEAAWDQPLLFVLAYHEGRFALVSTEWNEGIQPWNFGLEARELEEGGQTMTWTLPALPLYKPGDRVDFKIIRRESAAEGLRPPREKHVLIQVEDSRGKKIESFELELTQFGTASAGFDLPEHAPLGQYWFLVGTNENDLRDAGSFRVDAYRKPTFDLEIKTAAESVLIEETVTAQVTATYHFGAPVRGQPAEYTVWAEATDFAPPRFEDYTIQDGISDPTEPEEPVPTVASGKTRLDESGRVEFGFKTVPAHRPQPRNFTIEATITDVDMRTASRRKTVLVHPASFYLGLKADKYLTGPGEPVRVQVIAVRPDGSLAPGVTAELALYKRTWNTVRRKGVGGFYHYISKPQDTLVQTVEVVTEAQPVSLEFTATTGGYYFAAARAKDEAGRAAASAVDFYVFGDGPAGWEHYDHDRIDLIADKDEYRPGETAVILIKSPFTEGTGLLTVERDGVRRHQLFQIESASPHLEVRIEEGDSPNVFVSVLLVRGRISEKLDEQGRDAGKPAFKAGYVELAVRNDNRRLKVEISPDRPEARPGEEVELSLLVTDAAGAPQAVEVAVVVADAALLQLSSENVYFPERLFFSPRQLAVWTADSRLNLVGRRHYGLKGAKPGGGGLAEGGERFRTRFVSLALFRPHVVTGADGRATLKFVLPDNLTTFKIFAVAGDEGERFGTGTGALVVTKPLLLQSALPNFGGVGDEFTAAVVVHNRGGAAGRAVVTMAGSNFEPLGPTTKELDLTGGQSVEVGFPVRLLPGAEAAFQFQVTLGQEKDAAEYRLPLRYPNRLLTAATYGQLTETQVQGVVLPEGADPDRGELTLTLSPSLAGSLDGALDYLDAYPHQCLEQQTSRVLGDLIGLTWKDRLGRSEKEQTLARQRIEEYLAGLAAYQSYEGGFTFWSGQRVPDPFLSAYVLQVLTYLDRAGFEVDQNVFGRVQAYVEAVLKDHNWPGWYGERETLAARAYLVSALAESGRPADAEVENLYLEREKLGPYELSLLLWTVALPQRDEHTGQQIAELVRLLFGRAVITSGEVHFEEKEGPLGLMASEARTNALALRALLLADPENPHLAPLARWLTRNRREGHWGSTQSNALVLLALVNYVTVLEKEPPDLTVEALLDQLSVARTRFISFEDPLHEARVPADRLIPGARTPLELSYEGKGTVYYTLRLNYALEAPDLEPRPAGFSLGRTYRVVKEGQENAPPGTQFQRGDLVLVEVTMLVPNQRHWVILEDVLPSGLEALNFDLPVTPQYLAGLLERGARPDEYYRRYWY